MKSTTNENDLQTLIGASLSSEYSYQEQEAELLAAAAEDFDGYSEWSEEIEATAWTGAQLVDGMLIKKVCEHSSCPHTRCQRSTRLDGIEI